MTARKAGLSACVLAVLLLAMSFLGGRAVMGAPAPGPAPHVAEAWVRLPAVSGRPGAGYFVVHGTSRADALVGAASPIAERVELHSMTMEGGVMKMRREGSFPVPAGGELRFAPGGAHLMLFGLSPSIKAGGKVPMTLSFQSGAKVTVEAEARAPGAAPAPKSGTGAPVAGAGSGHDH